MQLEENSSPAPFTGQQGVCVCVCVCVLCVCVCVCVCVLCVYASIPRYSCPRQGHLSMVVLLMRYGANPELLDGEGLTCLHIAAQFSLTSLVAYFISCRRPIVRMM